MKSRVNWLGVILVLLLAVGIMAGCSSNQPASDEKNQDAEQSDKTQSVDQEKPFYDGKTITLIVATKPGGGYDTYARLLAPKMEKYLPGSTIIVKNVPGAGHIIGANEIYHAKPDGLTFGTFNKGLITAQIVGMEGIKFDLTKMSWLGSPASEPIFFMVGEKSSFKTIEDVMKGDKEIILSSAGIGSSSHTNALLVAEILGLDNLKMVTGYKGTEGEMAMMRGELDGQIGSADSMLPLVESGDGHPILVIGKKRLKDFPDVPTLYEVSDEKNKSLVDFMVSQALISRPYAATPDIPQERYEILQDAFEKAWSDPELLAEAEKIGRPIDYISGQEVSELMEGALNQPEHIVKILKEAVEAE